MAAEPKASTVKPDWRSHVPRWRTRPAPRARVVAGGVRGRTGQLHDRDRGLRPAGADAALVVRSALHLPAAAAAHGLLAPVRGGVSRQSGARLPRRQQWCRRQRAGDRPRARPCGLLARTICSSAAARTRATPRSSSTRPAMRARSSATSRPTGSRRSSRCSMRRCPSSNTSISTSRCAASAFPEYLAPDGAPRGCLPGALCHARYRDRIAPQSRNCARRCRLIRSAICSGSSPPMRRRWRAGSATSSWPCARNPFTSIRCSPRRS